MIGRRLMGVLFLVLAGCGGASGAAGGRTSAVQGPDAYAGMPTVYDVVNDGSPMSRDRLLQVAAYIRRLEADRDGVWRHDETRRESDETPTEILVRWILETGDVHVVVGSTVMAAAENRGADVGELVTASALFGQAAYSLEHPGADPESVEVQVAGIEFALHWYEQTLRAGERHNTLMDELLVKRDQGDLVAWYRANSRNSRGG